MNVGASKPEDYGDYFAWGETSPQSSNTYSWSSYKWRSGSDDTMTKYSINSQYGNNGFTDNKTVLDLEDDAAHANWGGDWRMPTKAEYLELINNTTSEWTTLNGVNGCKFTSKTNGNSIFLPAAGFRWRDRLCYDGSNGGYWSSSLVESYSDEGWSIYFLNGYVGTYYGDCDRDHGLSLRPVRQN